MNDEELELYAARSQGWFLGVDDWNHGWPMQTIIDRGGSPDKPYFISWSQGYVDGWTWMQRRWLGEC